MLFSASMFSISTSLGTTRCAANLASVKMGSAFTAAVTSTAPAGFDASATEVTTTATTMTAISAPEIHQNRALGFRIGNPFPAGDTTVRPPLEGQPAYLYAGRENVTLEKNGDLVNAWLTRGEIRGLHIEIDEGPRRLKGDYDTYIINLANF